MEQTANDVDQVKRSSSLDLIGIDYTVDPYTSFQKTNYGRASTDGSFHRIRPQIITLRVVLITKNQQLGFSKETFTRNGNQKELSSGFTESVRLVPISIRYPPDGVLTFQLAPGRVSFGPFTISVPSILNY